MASFYSKSLASIPLLILLCFSPFKGFSAEPVETGAPYLTVFPDSLARLGHCKAVIVIDTLCGTEEITLSAFIDYTFTGIRQPFVGTWSNGLTAHKITVIPPGTWSWSPAGTTCEEYHWSNEASFDFNFFDGPIEIYGPTAICPNDGPLELTTNINGFGGFNSVEWSPENPAGAFEPYPISTPGTYGITVTDGMGCTSSDQVTIIQVPIFIPAITGPTRLCPEGDSGELSVVNPAQYNSFTWDNGEVVSPITISEPGLYLVTATDSHGCTGVGSINVQSGDVGPFNISVTSPALCPGQIDTLRVVGGFSNYAWSNNVTGITNIVNQAGTYTVTVTNIYGCTGTLSATVTPLLPPIIQVNSTPLCLGDTAVLIATGGSFPQYNWSSGQSTAAITTLMPGTYTVTVSGAGVCPTATSTVLDYAPAPTTLIAPAASLNCLVLQMPLDASQSSSGPAYPLNWTTPDGHFVSGDSTLNPVVDAPGTYILSILDTLTGCFTLDTALVLQDILPPPADAGPPATLTCATPIFDLGPIPAPSNPDLLPSWSTSDGNILSGNNTWMPQVNLPGNYQVTVTNALNGCTSTANVVVGQDIAPPSALIAPTNLLTCMQGTVPLDGSGSSSGPNFTYLWTTNDGILSGPNDGQIGGASAVGTYELWVTNTLNGCTASTSVTVAADVNIPTVSALPTEILTCTLLNTTLDASASSSGPTFTYNWTTSNGNIVSGGNTLTPTVDAPGTYTLNLLNSANNCAATMLVTVAQNLTPPLADAGLDAMLSCSFPMTSLDGSASSSGPNFTYQWTSVDGNILSGADTQNPVVDLDGTYVLQVIDLSNGCTATANVQIVNDANAPDALIAAPGTLTCATQQTLLDAGASTQMAGLTYVWSGNILSGQGTLSATVDQPGVYTLTITNPGNGCTDVASVTVGQDIVAPNVQVGPNVLLNCFAPAGEIGSLGNPSGPGFSLQWTTTGGNILPPSNGPTALIDQSGDYQLLVTNLQNGCTATDVVTVNADFASPSANAGPTSELTCVQIATTLQGSGSAGPVFSYLWTTLDGNIASGNQTLTPTVDNPGTYNLLITNTQNGCTASSPVAITENANGPTAAAGTPQTLSCALTETILSAQGSSAGPEFTYAWSAGPGGNIISAANTLNPTIDAPGTYTVTVTNTSNFCTQTASVTILENVQTPVVDAGSFQMLTCAVTSLSLNAQIVFSTSQNIGYQWDSPDGQIQNGANTATPNIDAPGLYNVTVTDAANGCTGTDQVSVLEDVTPPLVVLSTPGAITCANAQVAIDALGCTIGAQYVYQWTSTAGGNFVSTQNPQLPLVDAAGEYTLLITNQINGCSESSSVVVLEDTASPTAEAGASLTLDCDTPTQLLNGAGTSQGPPFSYSWTTTNGQITAGQNTLTPSVSDPGFYVLTVLNTENGCSSLDSVSVLENVIQPALSIAPPPTLTCLLTETPLLGSGTQLGSAPIYLWTASGGGNIVSGQTSASPTVNAPGNYQLTVFNPSNGCSNSINVTVTENIQSPTVQIQPAPMLTCAVQQIDLQGIVPAQAAMIWSTSNGNILSGANTASPMVNAAGTYQLSLTSLLNGCTSSAEVMVQEELNVPEGLVFELLPPLCNGTPGMLTVEEINGGVGPFAYSIDGGQTFFTAQAFNTLSPGNYDLVIQDANGCEISETVEVPSPPIPLVTAPPAFDLELGQGQALLATVPSSFPLSLVDTVIWTPSTGLTFTGNSTLELLNPVAQPYSTTAYTVKILTKEGCASEARTIVRVDRSVDIYAPNVIWPEDPDGNNATFTLFARDESIANIKKLQIFDRWGSLVFVQEDIRPNDTTAGWSGDLNGVPVNPAVFVWWAEVELIDGRELLIKGDVTVVR